MAPSVRALICLSLLATTAAATQPAGAGSYGGPPATLHEDLNSLVRAYPSTIASHDDTWIVLRDGRRIPISDGRTNKTLEELFEQSDIDDMFFQPYRRGVAAAPTKPNFDPGRARCEALFDAMYGDCTRGEVEPKLRQVAWLPKHGGGFVSVTTVNGVDKALDAVVTELDALPEPMMPFLTPTAGSYTCRKIAGSRARSAHAWGIAIDINIKASDYWRWEAKQGVDPVWRNRIPLQIVRVFERHGFIWGGAWSHYDTMHFEYRPELLP
jgi:hypothetical protein